VAHVFSQNNVKLPYERIFRSFHRLLLDTAAAEYDFLLNFFAYRRHMPKSQLQQQSSTSSTSSNSSTSLSPVSIHVPPSPAENGAVAKPSFEAEFANSLAQTQREQNEVKEIKEEKESVEQNVALPTFGHDVKEEDEEAVMGIPEKDKAKRRAELAIVKNMFAQIFRKTFALFSSNLEEHLLQCCDPIGIMLMIRVICQHNKIMQAKRIHCLDRFHDGTNMFLWPKFKVVFDANVQSVKDVSYARVKSFIYMISFFLLFLSSILALLLFSHASKCLDQERFGHSPLYHFSLCGLRSIVFEVEQGLQRRHPGCRTAPIASRGRESVRKVRGKNHLSPRGDDFLHQHLQCDPDVVPALP